MEDLFGLVHVPGWELYDLHDLGNGSVIGSVLLCTGRFGTQHFKTADT